jgi:hypothetical protein
MKVINCSNYIQEMHPDVLTDAVMQGQHYITADNYIILGVSEFFVLVDIESGEVSTTLDDIAFPIRSVEVTLSYK